MEEYVLDGVKASGDAVLDGLGDVMVQVAELVMRGIATPALSDIEDLFADGGRAALKSSVQLVLDTQADAEQRLPEVTGADGVTRTLAQRSSRPVITEYGTVTVRRFAYRTRQNGRPDLHVRDGVLNLPPGPYSWRLREMAVRLAREDSYETARENVLFATGVSIGTRQLKEIAAAAAADAAEFYAGPADQLDTEKQDTEKQDHRDGQEDGTGLPLGMSSDGKGVNMLPRSRRTRAKAPEAKVRNFQSRAGIGEKGTKRMAQVTCVFDVIPQPRTPEQVMAGRHGGSVCRDAAAAIRRTAKPAPRAVRRRYRVDIAAGRAEAIRWMFNEAEHRDPGHDRDWIVLVDGDKHQIALIEDEAARRSVTVTILIDLIHVLEYLWRAGWALHEPRDPAIETWTLTQVLDILHGRADQVTSRIRQLAGTRPPASSEHKKNIRRVLSYLEAKMPYLDYPAALAAGWPVATGVIEGACRHLVKDRMGITGARWSTAGAQAILWLRVIRANADHDTYWTHHKQQEHQRNHLSRFQDPHVLAA
jgi:hypothetical protein